MIRTIRIRIAERRFYRAVGECIAYNRLPLGQWHVTVASALARRRDALAGQLALAIAS